MGSGCYPDLALVAAPSSGVLSCGRDVKAAARALAAILTWRRVLGVAQGLGCPNVTFGTNKKLSIKKTAARLGAAPSSGVLS